MEKSRFNVKTLAVIGVMSALVFASSWISIPIGDITRLHLGNSMCLLAGMLFGPLVGGLSAGLGSMFFDFTNPLYMPEFWITFLMKFAMGFVAGLVCKKLDGRLPNAVRYPVSGFCGAVLYIVLYLVKKALYAHFVQGLVWEAVKPVVLVAAGASLFNGAAAVVISALLAPVLKAALERAGFFGKPPARAAG